MHTLFESIHFMAMVPSLAALQVIQTELSLSFRKVQHKKG